MVLHPEIQTRAQQQLDHFVGQDRLPTFKDFENLPYIRAIVKEILRWRGVTPLGMRPCILQSP
jgi:cytochrome P450